MDLHSKMTMFVTSTMTSPVTKTAKTSKWLRLMFIQGGMFIPDSRVAQNERVFRLFQVEHTDTNSLNTIRLKIPFES
jgi:hypothetical protein